MVTLNVPSGVPSGVVPTRAWSEVSNVTNGTEGLKVADIASFPRSPRNGRSGMLNGMPGVIVGVGRVVLLGLDCADVVVGSTSGVDVIKLGVAGTTIKGNVTV